MTDQFAFSTDNASALLEQPKGKRCFHSKPERNPFTFEVPSRDYSDNPRPDPLR